MPGVNCSTAHAAPASGCCGSTRSRSRRRRSRGCATTWALPPVQRPKRRRGGRQLKLFEKATPGESVQVDVKVIKLGNTKAYQYTACDDCTRFRVLRLYRRQNTLTSLEFLNQIV